jgi:hypothetical protein
MTPALSMRARPSRSFSSTTPRTVSPSRHADFMNVSTATLTPSLFTSYETFLGTRVRASTASRQPVRPPADPCSS